jgi:flavodoxin
MKNIVVYYSWTGNTEVVAREIHDMVGGDLKKIEEVKQRTGGIGFAGGAFSAMLGLKSKIKPMDFSMSDYENIFLGGQVWASHSAPAINAFLDKADLKDKKVYLFLTKADDKVPQKVIDSISQRVERKGGKFIDALSITTSMKSVISPEAVRKPAEDWLRKNSINVDSYGNSTDI